MKLVFISSAVLTLLGLLGVAMYDPHVMEYHYTEFHANEAWRRIFASITGLLGFCLFIGPPLFAYGCVRCLIGWLFFQK